MPVRLGLIVNPIAGMGGRVGLKGTDGPERLLRALERGARPAAPARARRALARLPRGTALLAAPGALGADDARAAGLDAAPLARAAGEGAEQTRAAADALAAAGVDLILFAGGDGTARDVTAAVAGRVPLLGIPAGVKMHSGCFAATPEAAGEVAAAYLRDPRPQRLAEAEIADRDDDGAIRLHATARVPRAPARVLAAKGGGSRPGDDAALGAACARIAEELRAAAPGTVTLVGPGTTTARVLGALGLDATPLGIDALRDGALVARDASEAELLALLDGAPADAPAPRLLLGVVGGQGSLLGRGNQQLSPAVLRRVERTAITVVADRSKLLALDPLLLRVDTGDPRLDHELSGHVRVRVSARETLMAEVAA